MKGKALSLLAVLLAAPLATCLAEQIIPAGSLLSCTLAEPRLSSKNTAIGDPVLCQLGHAERYGRSVLPFDSYLVGRFEDYRDPGHFVGKGWMELRFDRMVIEPDTIVPVDARVVDVPGYNVDRYGRILGKGHAVRDTVTWFIPILWPIDLINLPRRGPRPTLKEETRLTLKVMNDMEVPDVNQPQYQQDPSGLYRRQPTQYQQPAPPPPPPPQPTAYQPAYQPDYQPAYQPAPQPVINYQPPPVQRTYIYYVNPPAPVVSMWAPAPMVSMWVQPRMVVIYRNGYMYRVAVPY